MFPGRGGSKRVHHFGKVDGYHSVTELCNQLQVEVATIQPSRLVDGTIGKETVVCHLVYPPLHVPLPFLMDPSPSSWTIGTVCLAVYSSDGLYYRAEIIGKLCVVRAQPMWGGGGGGGPPGIIL